MFAMATDPSQNRATWSAFPRIPWVLAGRAKPGATVLATPGSNSRDAAIASQPYGLGKVLWIGTNGTWRWRHRVGDDYHHRFWGQVVRWATSGKLAAGNRYVRFGPTGPRAAEGQGIRIEARIADGVAGVTPDLLIAARVQRLDPKTGRGAGEPVAVVPLAPAAGQPRTYQGTAPPLPTGAYAIRLEVPQLAAALQIDADRDGRPIPEARLDVVVRETSELVELAADRDPLERLAAATGGRVLADHEADQLAPLLHSRTRTITRTEETPLWDHPAALILFFSLLTVEWVAPSGWGCRDARPGLGPRCPRRSGETSSTVVDTDKFLFYRARSLRREKTFPNEVLSGRDHNRVIDRQDMNRETPRSRPPGCLRNPERVKDITSFPRSAWECRPGRSRVRLPPRTTQSVEDGIPTETVGTSRIACAVVVGEECLNRRPSDRRQADEHRPLPREMLAPPVLSRMVEAGKLSGHRVDPREVRPLVPGCSGRRPKRGSWARRPPRADRRRCDRPGGGSGSPTAGADSTHTDIRPSV